MYFAGGVHDAVPVVALDVLGSLDVAGTTNSWNFPVSPGAFDTSLSGSLDAFVTKLAIASAPVPTTLTLTSDAASNPVGTSQTVTATVDDANGQPMSGVIVRFTVTGIVTTSGQCTTGPNG